ncbi:MAG: hypothetical protein AB7H77_01205 [Bdellovibrionales bacterium]
MLRHIAWFNEAPVAPVPEGGLTSDDENVRRRCLAPARAIEDRGVGCSVFGNLHDADPVQVSRHLQKLNADIVVIGDISGPSRLRLARAAKHLGCYVVADFSGKENDDAALRQLAQLADQAVASTPKMAAMIEQCTGAAPIIIPNCDDKEDGPRSPDAIAQLWLDCFHHIKLKPSAGANTNIPA